GPRRVGPDPHLRHHGSGQLCARRAVHAGRVRRRPDHGGHRELLARADVRDRGHRRARRADPDHHAAAIARTRSTHHHPGHLRALARAAELCALAVRPGGPQDPGAHHRPLHALLPRLSLVPHRHRAAVSRDHRRALAVPQVRDVRGLDPGHDAGPRHGRGHGDPGPVGPHRGVRDRRRHGRGERGALRSAGGRQSRDGPRLDPEGLHRCGGGRPRPPGRVDRRVHLHPPARGLRVAVGEPGPGGHRVVRRVDPHPSLPPDRSLRADPEMTSARSPIAFWAGFGIVLGLLIVAPLVLPEFWRRFVTEILIWGLLAMSSDILIGYTGMLSFGHSAFFGLGMYGAATALLSVRPPNLWLALVYGLVAAAVVAAFVAYFSTRLRETSLSITTLVFSQIFYVIIFTWTEVTGGENGLTFSRPALSVPGLFSTPF